MADGTFADVVAACVAGTVPLSAARTAATSTGIRRAILVEGISDRAALETLAQRRGRSLEAEGIAVVPMGGAMSVRRFLGVLGPEGLDLEVCGLCDLGEERFFHRGLEAAGVGAPLSHERIEHLGFWVCESDLEDELIRALGVDGVERVIAAEGDLPALRTFQNQPFQRTQPIQLQLHRFVGTMGGRKERYARALVGSLDLDAVPRPLERVLDPA